MIESTYGFMFYVVAIVELNIQIYQSGWKYDTKTIVNKSWILIHLMDQVIEVWGCQSCLMTNPHAMFLRVYVELGLIWWQEMICTFKYSQVLKEQDQDKF